MSERLSHLSQMKSHGDAFFSNEQRERLEVLMAHWRAARDAGATLPVVEQRELENLVQEEVAAAGRRAAAMSRELRS